MVVKYTEADKERYEKFVSGHKNGSFMQSSFWPSVKQEWESIILICENDGEIKGTMSLLIRKMPIPIFNIKIAYSPRGPVCDYDDIETMRELYDAAAFEAKKLGCCVVKTDPDVSEDDEVLRKSAKTLGLKIVRHGLGYENMQPICNHKIDLTGLKNGDDILKAYNYKTRNRVRVSFRRGAEMVEGTEADIHEFYQVIKETEARKGILLRNEEYFHRMFDVIPKENLLFLLGKAEGKIIVGGIFILYGKKVTYSYSATADGAAYYSAGYLMQYEIMKRSAEAGMETYDMGGVDGNVKNDGIAVFKANFGGKVVTGIGELDKVISPLRYAIFEFSLGSGRKIMKKIKRIFRR